MAVTDISELRKKRQVKKTRNLIIKIFIVLLVCGVVLVAVFTKDMWYPYLSAMLTTIPETVQSDDTSAELAEGEFPIKVEGGLGYQLMSLDNGIAVLDDSQFHIYGSSGNVVRERQHTYANPVLCVSDNKALIYDEGGTAFSLESKYKTIYEKTADDIIYIAKLSSSDYAAVVTKSDKFLAMLKIYNADGEPVFTYYSYDSRIINVTFTNNSAGCVVTVLTAEGGQLISKMIRFDFSDTDPKWTSTGVPTLALDTRFTSDGGIIMVGDTMAAGFDSDGNLVSQFTYDYAIEDYDTNGELTGVLTGDSDLRRTVLVTISGSDCSSAITTVLDDDAEKVYIDDSEAYILSEDGIDVYAENGLNTASIALEDTYDDLCRNGKYIYLMGYDTINRIDYSD